MAILTKEANRKIVEVDFNMWYFVIDCYDEAINEAMAKNHFTLNEELHYNTHEWSYTYNE